MKILVTGGTGFIGSRLVIYLREQGHEVMFTTRDRFLTRNDAIYHDLRAPVSRRLLERLAGIEAIVHAAAEVSGARSLQQPGLTVETNVLGTYHTLEAARALDVKKFLYLSTGEVVGHVPSPQTAGVDVSLRPSSPYSASKAAGEELCRVYRRCFNVPAITARVMNVFGHGQRPPRFVPSVVAKLLRGEVVTYHGVGDRAGSRNWMHVDDCVRTLTLLLTDVGAKDEVYHVVGPELDNRQVIVALSNGLGVKDPRMTTIVPPTSHDMRYALRPSSFLPRLDNFEVLTQLFRTAYDYKEDPACLGL